MADRKKTSKRRSSRSGSARGSNSRTESKRGSSSATRKEQPSRRSPTGGDQDDSNGGMSKGEEAKTGGKEMGRPPSDEPDVYVYVPQLHVGELNIDVERLEAHLALRAQVANLVNLVAGVHVGVDKVKIDLKDVDAEAELKVRLENTYNILDRTLTTLDENPKILEGVVDTAGSAVEQTGQIGKETTKPGDALSELTSGVGDSLGNLTSSIGDSLSSVAQKADPKQLTTGGESSKSSGNPSNGSPGAKAAAIAAASGLTAGLLAGLARGNGGAVLKRARKSVRRSLP